MCGIICEIINSESILNKDEHISQRIQKRGPDSFRTIKYAINANTTLVFCGSVLWMQGRQLTEQPVENEKGILLFNGDIYDDTWNQSTSDTQVIMNKFSESTCSDTIIKDIQKLKGPFSLIYFDKSTQNLYFTRDHIGRNTLLCYNSKDSLIISSVLGKKYPCVEIPATHLCKFNLQSNKISLYNWQETTNQPQQYYIHEWYNSIQKQQNLPDEDFIFNVSFTSDETLHDEDHIIEYIEKLSHEYCSNKSKSIFFEKLMNHSVINNTIKKLSKLLENSVKIRLERQPAMCKNCVQSNLVCCHSATGVLFSGGLDCTILALLADRYVPKNQSIDLLNVAFAKRKNHTSYDVPDRITGRQSLEELKTMCPTRNWVFREINVSIEKLEKYQSTVIADLIFPRHTVLDESLGSALWFAASGQDHCDTSPSRVLLVGSGADELFGGYIRHRNALKRQGWSGLSRELLLDWKRISFRNLARDNRVICDHGRQPRMPYLDEDFVDFVTNLKPWLRCFPTADLEIGIGDKLILRLLAFNLGLTKVVTFPKRALQFGSRIANKKEKGRDISKTFELQ